MVIIDSSVWIGHFQNILGPTVQNKFETVINDEDIGIIGVIATEVLTGFKHDLQYSTAKNVLDKVPQPQFSNNTYMEAAELYRKLRKKGVTVRGAIDCIIAQVCMDLEAQLFTLDHDFEKISEHTSLQLIK